MFTRFNRNYGHCQVCNGLVRLWTTLLNVYLDNSTVPAQFATYTSGNGFNSLGAYTFARPRHLWTAQCNLRLCSIMEAANISTLAVQRL